MAKKKEKTVKTAEPESHEIYYHVDHLELNGTFTNCQININTGSPGQPPPPPGDEGG
jgi:hypothetical protein